MRRSVLGLAAAAAVALLLGRPLHAQEQKLYNEYGPQFENCGDGSLDRAIANGWLSMHESGTYVTFTQTGTDLFA